MDDQIPSASALLESRPTLKRSLSQDNDAEEDHKRRRTDHDRNIKTEETHPAEHRASMFSPLYKFHQKPHAPSQPHASQDLIELYGLGAIAGSVLRKNPVTGEKINVLRKSYEGKIKDLSGKNKAKSTPRELSNLIQYPDEEWNIQKVYGKEMERGLSEKVMADLEKAVRMLPGRLPEEEQERWDNFLNEPVEPKKKDVPLADDKGGAPKSRPMTGESALYHGGMFSEPLRPQRQGTKRRYNEDSFEGYGEGFVDDGADSASFTDDGDARTMKKKRRKARKRP